MRYADICAGISAPTVAWPGWQCVFHSEIAKFPRAVLQHHYPDTPLEGDFTELRGDEHGPVDLIVGGTPCQSFSVAGLRGGLADDRGNLALEFLRLVGRSSPAWVLWENVPGVLSSASGRDFGAFLGGLGELGYGWSYRVLDAQFFGVPQRRRRVFVVGYLGDWRPAAAVLFERASLQGHPAPGRKARQAASGALAASAGGCEVGKGSSSRGEGPNGAGFGKPGDPMFTLQRGAQHAIAFSCKDHGADAGENAPTLRAMNEVDGNANAGGQVAVASGMSVRRLTPTECERLQGFPDGWTAVPYRGKPAADGPRYQALGNSMAVPVLHWIGNRIEAVNALKARVA